jgi:hypothetical protein
VSTINRIGATRTMEDFISYILTIVLGRSEKLRPVYSVVPSDPMEERIEPGLRGYGGDGPVRVGNEAAMQDQHDTYGSIILAASPMFFDRRLPRMGDVDLFRRIEALGEKAAQFALGRSRDLGVSRAQAYPHHSAAAMCWAGCQRWRRSQAALADLPIAPRPGARLRRPAERNPVARPGTRGARPLPRRLAAMTSTPASCCSRNSA